MGGGARGKGSIFGNLGGPALQGLRAGFLEPFGRFRKDGVLDGGAVTAQVNGVHHCESAADAEGEAEEEADQGEGYAHAFMMSWAGF